MKCGVDRTVCLGVRPHHEGMTKTATTNTNSLPGTTRVGAKGSQPTLNISRLTEQLWTGGDLPDRFDEAVATIEAWRVEGIGHIIDNRIEWCDDELVEEVAPEIRYLSAGVDDAGQRMPDRWFDMVTEFANEAVELGGGVLIHCHMGINRGPSASYAVLLTQGWDPVEAIDLIRTARPIAAVGYAEDALNWWHRTKNIDHQQRRNERARLGRWRARHPHDTIRIIRQIRALEVTP